MNRGEWKKVEQIDDCPECGSPLLTIHNDSNMEAWAKCEDCEAETPLSFVDEVRAKKWPRLSDLAPLMKCDNCGSERHLLSETPKGIKEFCRNCADFKRWIPYPKKEESLKMSIASFRPAIWKSFALEVNRWYFSLSIYTPWRGKWVYKWIRINWEFILTWMLFVGFVIIQVDWPAKRKMY